MDANQINSASVYEQFIQALIADDSDLSTFLETSEFETSNRLGIRYRNIQNKFLISYNIDPEIKVRIRKNILEYSLITTDLGNDIVLLEFKTNTSGIYRKFYFKNEKLISPIHYHTEKWHTIESEYFRFIISDPCTFNDYAADNLDLFFAEMAAKLEYTQDQIVQIRNEKIYYVLCNDLDEIEQITGLPTMGIYNLAYDYIITTYNAHYHEISHLMINFKLAELPLYTHPFFQEGFAVGFGGRGGKEPEIILNLGHFILDSQLLNIEDLLSFNGFYNSHSSMTYPTSGVYNKFLFDYLGLDKYLELYMKYSSSEKSIIHTRIDQYDLPPIENFREYLKGYIPERAIIFIEPGTESKPILNHNGDVICQDDDFYYFEIQDTLLIGSDKIEVEYQSSRFSEVFHNRKYQGEKYLVLANENEVSIYNLYTNNLISNFVRSFSPSSNAVPSISDKYHFALAREYLILNNNENVLIKN